MFFVILSLTVNNGLFDLQRDNNQLSNFVFFLIKSHGKEWPFLTYSVTDISLKIRFYCWNSHTKILKFLERDSYSALVPDFYFITVTGYSMSKKFVQNEKVERDSYCA